MPCQSAADTTTGGDSEREPRGEEEGTAWCDEGADEDMTDGGRDEEGSEPGPETTVKELDATPLVRTETRLYANEGTRTGKRRVTRLGLGAGLGSEPREVRWDLVGLSQKRRQREGKRKHENTREG